MIVQNISNRSRRNIVSQITHSPGNSLIAPIWIMLRKLKNFGYNFCRNRFATTLFLIRIPRTVILCTNKLVIPITKCPGCLGRFYRSQQIIVQDTSLLCQSAFVGICQIRTAFPC